jgi:hypothetical protein
LDQGGGVGWIRDHPVTTRDGPWEWGGVDQGPPGMGWGEGPPSDHQGPPGTPFPFMPPPAHSPGWEGVDHLRGGCLVDHLRVGAGAVQCCSAPDWGPTHRRVARTLSRHACLSGTVQHEPRPPPTRPPARPPTRSSNPPARRPVRRPARRAGRGRSAGGWRCWRGRRRRCFGGTRTCCGRSSTRVSA